MGAIEAAYIPIPIALSISGDQVDIRIAGTLHQGGSRLVCRKDEELDSVRGQLIRVPGPDSDENLTLYDVYSKRNLRLGLDFKTIGIPFNHTIQVLKTNEL